MLQTSEQGFRCWLRARGGSKTRDMSLLAVFFAIREEQVLWYASSWAQLRQAQIYWSTNPFVMPMKVTQNRQKIELIDGSVIRIAALTESNVRGPRGNRIFYDEVAQMPVETFHASLAALSASDTWSILCASTPAAGTIFEALCNEYGYDHRPWRACSWINESLVETQRQTMPEWLFEQEYLAIFTVPGGAPFTKIVLHESSISKPVNRIGVDFHGDLGQVVVEVHFAGDEVYIIDEKQFPGESVENMVAVLSRYEPRPRIYVEDGGFNTGYASLVAKRMDGVTKILANLANQSKQLFTAISKTIHICPSQTPELYEDLRTARWVSSGQPKLEKSDRQPRHYLDAMLLCFQYELTTLSFGGWSIKQTQAAREIITAERKRINLQRRLW